MFIFKSLYFKNKFKINKKYISLNTSETIIELTIKNKCDKKNVKKNRNGRWFYLHQYVCLRI